MAKATTSLVLQNIRRLVQNPAATLLSDRQLLERLVTEGEEAAFETLVQRHGPMVQRVCRRVVGDHQNAEDAFQATFLVLFRKAKSIGRGERLAGWLYGVAYRIAKHAKVEAAQRNQRERRTPVQSSADPLTEITGRELCAILDEELVRLPEHIRVPFLLCHLEGQTRDHAARQLGWSLRSLERRLEQGRKLLQTRLTRRGVALPSAVVAAGLGSPAVTAQVPGELVHATVRAALPGLTVPSGEATVLSSQVAVLAEGAIRGMTPPYLKLVTILALGLCVATGSAGFLARQARTSDQPPPHPDQQAAQVAKNPGLPKPAEAENVVNDRHGDSLPPGAIARLGTIRWRLDPHGVDHMVISRDGKTLLSANSTTGVSVWDMATGKTLRQIPERPELRKEWLGRGSSIALSADAQTAAFCGRDGIVRLVDMATGLERRRWQAHHDQIDEADLCADAGILVTRSADATLRVWDTASAKQLLQLPLAKKVPWQTSPAEIAISPDGKTLAWIGDDATRLIHVVAVATGVERHRLGQHDGHERQVMFSPDSQTLLASDEEGRVQLWDLRKGELRRAWKSQARGFRTAAAFSPDGQDLIFRTGGDRLCRLDLVTGKELWSHSQRMISTANDVLACSPDGKTLVVKQAETGPVLCRYDTATGKRLLSPEEMSEVVACVAFSPDERTLFSFGDQGVLRSWEVTTGRELRQILVGKGQGLFSPDGWVLAVVENGTIRLSDCATGIELRKLSSDLIHNFSIVFSPDGQLLAGVEPKNGIVIWEVATGKEVHRFAKIPSNLFAFDFSGDGKELVGLTLSNSGLPEIGKPSHLYSWNLSSGRSRGPILAPPHSSGCLKFSPDGKTMVLSAENQRTIECWEVASGKKRLEITQAVSHWPPFVRFSPDGKFFLIAECDGTVSCHDPYSGQLLRRQAGHRAIVSSFIFSPTGRKVATISADTTVLLWNTADWLPAQHPVATKLSAEGLSTLWTDLAGADAARAYQAIGTLASAPAQSMSWLGKHLQPVPALDRRSLERFLTELDSDEFEARARATREIAKFGETALPAIDRALAGKPSVEARRRLEQLAENVAPAKSPEQLRYLRAIEVLEAVGSQEAKDLLKTLASGAPESGITRQATAALERLGKRLPTGH